MIIADLPVLTVLPELRQSLRKGHVLLSAPPGSGKTTAVPPALLQESWLTDKNIILLEPRRLAARAAARRMSFLQGEAVGQGIGYRTRLDSKVSAATRIEVVTEGILTRRLQRDPELQGVGLVIFDEFHERNLQADLGLALCLDLCILRPDLRILVMSATLDCRELLSIMENCRLIEAHGRSFPVQLCHLHPIFDPFSIARLTVRAILHALDHDRGDILAFLPGAGEIKACQKLLVAAETNCSILPLYGNLSSRDQDLAITPSANGLQRIILSTPIAETSLTIEGISIVVDSGFARRPRFDPATGLDRLEMVRISRASAEQRRGRAGRLGPGICYRLWDTNIEHSLQDFSPPEISLSDLSALVLDLALWGVLDPRELQWLTLPPEGAWQMAKILLQSLSALDEEGRITNAGRKLAHLPLHPRLGHMLLQAKKQGLGATACLLAAILSERDTYRGKNSLTDIGERLRFFTGRESNDSATEFDRVLCQRIGHQAKQWQNFLGCSGGEEIRADECGQLLAFAFPDRIGVLREQSRDRYLMAGGRGAILPPGDLLAGNRLLIFPHLDAGKGEGKVYLAAPLSLDELKAFHPHLLCEMKEMQWDDSGSHITLRQNSYLGKAVVESSPLTVIDYDQLLALFLQGIQRRGVSCLPWSNKARCLQARIESLRFWKIGTWPDFSDTGLLNDLQWLAPYCLKMRRLNQLAQLDLHSILLSLLPWNKQKEMERLVPERFPVASGSQIKLDYSPGQSPVLAVRLQELFGQTETPAICNGRIPVLLHLLSPARRPVQVTSDLVSFWHNTYPQVRKELAGRYPKHYWPDDPLLAMATTRCKPR
ncbi:MAG: ATP-dependent helicase HrpB [Proteobacteria bacterium]|nr:ATP-dependent helicase HrpB [Pseudomonadota bacterium]MBU1059625.1 ATP-dependent helicase HrpB [Pseudomonadota bacterium]